MKNKNKLVVIILLFAVSVAVSVFIFPTEEQFEYSYDKGAQWLYDDLYAPYDFAICRSDDDIQAEKDSIVSDFIPYYSFDTLEPRKFVSTNCTLLEKTIGEKTSLEKEEANAFAQNFKDKLSAIYEKGVINPSDKSEYVNAGNKIRVVRDNVGELDLISDFYTKSSAKEEMLAVYASDSRMYEADSLSGFYVRDFIEKTVFVTNVAIDEELNDKYLQSRIDAVLPMSGMVHKGELIISKGKVVDEHSKRLLDSYKMQFENTSGSTSFWMAELGVIIVFLILFAIILFYSLKFGRQKNWGIRENLFVLLQMILLSLVVFFVFKYSTVSINIVPFVLVPLLLVTFIDFDISFLIYFISIFIVSFFAVNRFEFVFIQTVTGLVGMFSLRNTSKRQQIFISMIVVFVTYSLLHTGFSLMRLGTFSEHELEEFIYYGISSAALLLYLPFVFIFEKIFGFISGFTLVELCDTNNPALRELSEKAPGTFQHSVMLSNLVESVVREIGGKPLLARAGALYHDIGKTYAPEYFIENQNGGKSAHDGLPYEESAQKIIAHVTKGVEFAAKYKLPDQIVDFIEQHHGTSVTRYFYNSWVNANP
ncbi:MAG: HDIG domain-containing protein, partial [Bacteroidales bacterium]|nr:HDIG domain-containing protein [Bacteroidales bacterium]